MLRRRRKVRGRRGGGTLGGNGEQGDDWRSRTGLATMRREEGEKSFWQLSPSTLFFGGHEGGRQEEIGVMVKRWRGRNGVPSLHFFFPLHPL